MKRFGALPLFTAFWAITSLPSAYADEIYGKLSQMQDCVLSQCVEPKDVTSQMIVNCMAKADLDKTKFKVNIGLVTAKTLGLLVLTPGTPPQNLRELYGNCSLDCTTPELKRTATAILNATEQIDDESISGEDMAFWTQCRAIGRDGNCTKECPPGEGKINKIRWVVGPKNTAVVYDSCLQCPEGFKVIKQECRDDNGCSPREEYVTYRTSSNRECKPKCPNGWIRSRESGDCEVDDIEVARKTADQLTDLIVDEQARFANLGGAGSCKAEEISQIVSEGLNHVMDMVLSSIPGELKGHPNSIILSHSADCDPLRGPNRNGSKEFTSLINQISDQWERLIQGP